LGEHDIVTTLPEILHNIADHTETFLRLMSERGLSPDLVDRMIDHISLEERENSAELQALHSSSPTPLTQKLLDHSFFLQKIMKDESIPVDLKQELLGHFIEEHQTWQAELQTEVNSVPQTQVESAPESRTWTVGPMWQQGG
jgi:hypothetical protein